MMTVALCLFRQNFRMTDNPPLHHALQEHDTLHPLFMFDGSTYAGKPLGGAQGWWLHQALLALNASLNALGHGLYILTSTPESKVKDLITYCQQHGITAIYTEQRWEPTERNFETALRQACTHANISLYLYNASLLQVAHEGTKEDGSPYLVFTPYWKKQKPLIEASLPACLPAPTKATLSKVEAPCGKEAIHALGLMPTVSWYTTISTTWDVSEAAAQHHLKQFVHHALHRYDEQRNFPAQPGTSRLSPYLHHGLISVRQVYTTTLEAIETLSKPVEKNNAHVFLSELGWREFAHHQLYYFPHTMESSLKEKYQAFPWKPNADYLQAWQQGKTGFPIVDAAMRQLWHTGWMHNRLRMVVGSFLVKHLLQPWQDGEAWFWDTLLDGNVAANTFGWQWVAGCGADASPYFRVFNPISQSEKFDKEGHFIREWVPELRHVSNEYIHTPWEMNTERQRRSQVLLGVDYPYPIISHEAGRKQALEAFKAIK
jgi:deoxyribodipyrimidine photo-lyase